MKLEERLELRQEIKEIFEKCIPPIVRSFGENYISSCIEALVNYFEAKLQERERRA